MTTSREPPQRVGLSIRLKAALLLVLVALAPTLSAALLLGEVNREAVVLSERKLQAAVLAEIATAANARILAAEDDAKAIAQALAAAAQANADDPDPLSGAKALAKTRRNVLAARFEVPSAKVSQVILRRGEATVEPASESLRQLADERGQAFEARGSRGVLVVPIPRGEGAGAKGYVTCAVDLDPLAELLTTLATTRFEGSDTRLLIADTRRVAVAAEGIEGVAPGADVAGQGVWRVLPEGTPWTAHTGIVQELEIGGVEMVGGVETVPDLGWAIALWRPRAVAYASLEQMRTRSLLVGAGALLLALVVGLLGGRAITRPVLRLMTLARRIGERRYEELPQAQSRSDELGALETSMHQMAADIQAGEQEIEHQARLRGDLSRFLSQELVEQIVQGEHSLELGGQRRAISVVFADVVAFTPLAEGRQAEEVVALLNELFSVLSEIVFRHGGTVDKFIGDCVMAVWGAPVAQEDHADRALTAAEDMLRFLETANEEFRDKYGVEIRLGIGVNSGEAIVGNIGSKKRMEYTVIGDVVNVAARLEAIAKPNQVLVAEATAKAVSDPGVLLSVGPQNLTGRSEPIEVFELDWA